MVSPKSTVQDAPASQAADTPKVVSHDMTPEQRRIALGSLRKLVSAIQIELPFVYVEKDGKRFYTLSAKRGAVLVDVVVTTEIPK